jgi:hypothetical protein
MSRIHCIALPNPAPVLSTFIAVHHRENDQDWEIVNIELYADVERTKLLADGIDIYELSRDQQEKIYAALEAYTDDRRRQRRAQARLEEVRA